MLVTDFDPTRDPDKGQIHVRLIHSTVEEMGDARRGQQVGYWCDLAHLEHMLKALQRVRQQAEDHRTEASSCGQCGQRTPVCEDCGDSIIFVPVRGFGNTGEWRHLAPPLVNVGHHMARPKVFITPPKRAAESAVEATTPDA